MSKKSSDIIDDGKSLLSASKKPVQVVNEPELIHTEMTKFFIGKLQASRQDDALGEMLEQRIMDAAGDGSLSLNQVIHLYKFNKSSKIHETRTILEGMKPVPNATSPLLDRRPDEEDASTKHYSATELAVFDQIMRASQMVAASMDKDTQE